MDIECKCEDFKNSTFFNSTTKHIANDNLNIIGNEELRRLLNFRTKFCIKKLNMKKTNQHV